MSKMVVLERLANVEEIVRQIKKSVDENKAIKAASMADDLIQAAHHLFNATYRESLTEATVVVQGSCAHKGGKTDVQGGGQSCNKCGAFC